MSFVPFSRGQFPVGVRTSDISDPSRDGRVLTTEIWYPAAPSHAGQDADPDTRDSYSLAPGLPVNRQRAVRAAAARPGLYPLVLFSHGFGSHRRQTTFLCTHLASHGYVVAALDHAGNTFVDLVKRMASPPPAERPKQSMLDETAEDRPADIGRLLDALLDAGQGLPEGIELDAERVGISGHSMGGWTALATFANEPRLGAAVLLAPAGGAAGLRRRIAFAWPRRVPTLLLAAEGDSILAVGEMRELFADLAAPKRLLTIADADHMHFVDGSRDVHEMVRRLPGMDRALRPHQPIPPFDELCAAEPVHEVVRGLAVAHFDAYLRGSAEAAELIESDLVAQLAARGLAGRSC